MSLAVTVTPAQAEEAELGEESHELTVRKLQSGWAGIRNQDC